MHATPLYCAEPARRDTAQRLAERFALPQVKQRPDDGYWLELGPERLELLTTGKHGAVYAEFVAGAAKHRREQGGGRGQPVAKAVGLKGAKDLPRIVDATAGLGGETSLANSAGIMIHADARRDWGRPGIMLYGATPLPAGHAANVGLKAVMQLTTRIFGVRELAAGEPVGYGASFHTERPTRVGLMACGYADGYPRLASTGSPVLIDGVKSRVIGRVSMDMMTVDLTDIPQAAVGSTVELWGDNISVNDVAAHAGTIGYEVLCNVKRAHFRYE